MEYRAERYFKKHIDYYIQLDSDFGRILSDGKKK